MNESAVNFSTVGRNILYYGSGTVQLKTRKIRIFQVGTTSGARWRIHVYYVCAKADSR